jgi:hypothetical protein
MVAEIPANYFLNFSFKSTVVFAFSLHIVNEQYVGPTATPASSYSGKNVQAFRSGDIAGHSMFSLREITRAGNITLRTRIAVHAV